MASHYLDRAALQTNTTRVLIQTLDEWSHIAVVGIYEAEGRLVRLTDKSVVRHLIGDKIILPQQHLSEDRRYIHRQPAARSPASHARSPRRHVGCQCVGIRHLDAEFPALGRNLLAAQDLK